MPITHKHEADAIADLVGQFQRNVNVVDMRLPDLERLGAAYLTLAEALPWLAGSIDGFADKAALALSAADIKSGEPGTWAQRQTRRKAEVDKFIAGRRTS